MKTYLSVGIGDMMCLDSVLNQEERTKISEIYWACRFGKDIAPLMENNKFYPNLKSQHIIPDDVGIQAMQSLEPTSINFWHFRPDFERNFLVGLSLFNLSTENLNIINAASIFMDPNRNFQNSSFIDCAKQSDVNWDEIGVKPYEYILFHYPTSTRPRSDIATISDSDWEFIESLSLKNNVKIVIISDTKPNKNIQNSILLLKPNIKSVVSLCKFAKYYAGCDSFVSILCCKVIDSENLFIKSHNINIQTEIFSNIWLQRFFLPHKPESISKFYKNYIGY